MADEKELLNKYNRIANDKSQLEQFAKGVIKGDIGGKQGIYLHLFSTGLGTERDSLMIILNNDPEEIKIRFDSTLEASCKYYVGDKRFDDYILGSSVVIAGLKTPAYQGMGFYSSITGINGNRLALTSYMNGSSREVPFQRYDNKYNSDDIIIKL